MGNKVKKSRQRRGWRKTNAKRLHEEMKARKLQAENVEDKENTPAASVNIPVVDISLQNKFVSSDEERERQLQIENFEDKENTVASVNVPVIGTSLLNKESSDELVRVNFMDDTDSKIYQTLDLMPITPEQNSCLPVEGEINSDMTYSHRENIAINIKIEEVIQRGNLLNAKVTVKNCYQSFATTTSSEFVINGAALFQMRLISTCKNVGYNQIFNNMVFVRFAKRCHAEDLTYTIYFNSVELKIKTFTSDDGMWRLIHQDSSRSGRQQFTFDVAVEMRLPPSASSFAYLHEDTELTDFEMRGEDGSVRMHRAVLAAASPVLRRMLGGAWRETAEGRVDVTGTSKATLEHFKNYLYLHVLPESGLEQLLLLSSYYIMPELERLCVERMVRFVSAGHACDLIKFAVKHNVTRLLVEVLECVQNGAITVTEILDHIDESE